jgi:hypothetical protein
MDTAPTTPAVIDSFLAGIGCEWRRVAQGEWGLTLEAAGRPLHVGIALRGGLLRAQTEALAPGRLHPHDLLHRNRGLEQVRYAHTAAGAVWVHGDLPESAVSAFELDRMLGALVSAAIDARHAATEVRLRAEDRPPRQASRGRRGA